MSRTTRRVATLIATLALSITALAAPAQAAPSSARDIGDCPAYYACLWTLTNWQGVRWQGRNANSTLPDSIDNNSWSSFNNGRNCTVHFWTGPGYTGQAFNEVLGSRRADLRLDARPGGYNWADVISSVSWC